jgi:hypothetical protein
MFSSMFIIFYDVFIQLTMNIRTFHLDWTNNTDFWLRTIQSPYDLTRRWCLMLS